MNKLSIKELENYIKEILECDAFELHSDSSLCPESANRTNNYYIPYMMNDALECCLLLKNCRMTGKYISDLKEEITVESISKESISTENISHENISDSINTVQEQNPSGNAPSPVSSAIIFRQGTENVFTIWFEEAFRILKCFRYDRIGHFWIRGAEHWRRLVYIIGTMYDKYEYMGNQVCNEKEMALFPLMEFAPFRMYSPIHESLDMYYTESTEGLECISSLARQAGDRKFLRLLIFYSIIPVRFMRSILFHSLNHPDRQNLYELIFHKVQEASMEYPERSYHPMLNAEITNAREQVTHQLHQAGFQGSYPLFHKDHQQILAMEEHPFTILEAKDFSFRIQFMVSETKSGTQTIPLNAGFFKKRGNRSRIVSSVKNI